MLARRLRTRLELRRRKAAARARLERREAEEKAKLETREVERRVGRREAESWSEAARASEATLGAKEARVVAEVDARWRDWLAAVRSTAAKVQEDLRRRLHEAEVARGLAEAAAARAEADRAEMAAECEGMAAALVRQAVAAPVAARPGRRLVVVEECEGETEVGTQTEVVGVATMAVQTEAVAAAEEAVEMVVGRRLHPAQAEAVARAERAAARIEQVQLKVEAAASRYSEAAQELSPSVELSTQAQKIASPTGGRQLRKARERRQAAAAGIDVLSLTSGKQQRRRELAEVGSEGQALQALLERRLDAAHEEWLQRQHAQGGAYVGEAQASVRFWQAAQNSGIKLLDVPD
jgi:hypothetical protein